MLLKKLISILRKKENYTPIAYIIILSIFFYIFRNNIVNIHIMLIVGCICYGITMYTYEQENNLFIDGFNKY